MEDERVGQQVDESQGHLLDVQVRDEHDDGRVEGVEVVAAREEPFLPVEPPYPLYQSLYSSRGYGGSVCLVDRTLRIRITIRSPEKRLNVFPFLL